MAQLSDNLGNEVYNAYPIELVNTGAYNMDATGTTFYNACLIWNANFALLFAPLGVTPLVINVSTAINNMQGDSAYTVFSKCNANFAYLGSLAQYSTVPIQAINVGAGPYNGVIGLGDPGVLGCIKVNENFAAIVA
jgi:hypothetical protein